jgi:hypothetical protein
MTIPVKTELFQKLVFAALILWGMVLLAFCYWQIVKRVMGKRPVKVATESGITNKDELLAFQRHTLGKVTRTLNRVLWFNGLFIILECLRILWLLAAESSTRGTVVFHCLMLAGFLVPSYLAVLLGRTIPADVLKISEWAEIIILPPGHQRLSPVWRRMLNCLNLLPLLALGSWVYLVAGPQFLARLGFAIGPGVAVAALSLVFFRKQALVGVLVTLIFLTFVLASYYLPQFDLPKKQWPPDFIAVTVFVLIGLVPAISASFLTMRPLLKKVGVFSPQMQPMLNSFRLSLGGMMAMLVVIPLISLYKTIPFCVPFVVWNIVCWVAVLAALWWSRYRGNLDFREVEQYVKNHPEVQTGLRKSTLLYLVLLVLLISTFGESFRGLRAFWGLTAVWMVLIFVALWQVWRYAFAD